MAAATTTTTTTTTTLIMSKYYYYYLPAAFLFIVVSVLNAEQLNVAHLGAIGDGKTDATNSFLRAWAAACNSSSPTMIYVPRKTYFLRSLQFQGPCKTSHITIKLDGLLLAPHYLQMGSSKNWLTFNQVDGVTLTGGFLDGQGTELWLCKNLQLRNCPAGATSLAIYSSKNVVIRNLKSLGAKLYHIVVHSCQDVFLEGVRIHAPEDSPNTDGIHVQNTANLRVLNTRIMTGDDCISIGPGTRNLQVERVACGPGHGISIGSLGKGLEEDGVQNITVKNVVFNGSQNGLRIKSWGRPSNGFVRAVNFKQVVMNNVQNPIVIDQNYCPRDDGCPNQNSGIKISQVTYQNIKGTSASQVAMKFDCSATSPCKGIGLQDIELTYQDHPAESFCRNIRGNAWGVVAPPSCL